MRVWLDIVTWRNQDWHVLIQLIEYWLKVESRIFAAGAYYMNVYCVCGGSEASLSKQ